MSISTCTINFGSLILVMASMLGTSSTANGTSIVFPKFSVPVLQEGRLIFASPEAKRLLCVSLEGKVVWERKYEFPIRLFTGPGSEALLQTGKVVSSVSPQSGDLRARFTIEDESDGVAFSSMLGSFVSRDLRFEQRMFKLLDGETGKPLWRNHEIDDILCATPELIVCLAADRIPSGKGYRFGKATLDGHDRKSFKRKWRVPLSGGSGVPFVPAAFKAPYLIYPEAMTSLVVLDCTTGRKRLTKQMEVPKYGWISDLKIHEDHLVWITHKMSRSDRNNTEHLLHFCTIPNLSEDRTVILKLIEIASISFESGFIISDALYRTACFRPDGDKVWERFQTARTPVANNRIYFSDYDKKNARLGFVEVPTGQETILYSEQVEDPKR